jgi:hypothetical protein
MASRIDDNLFYRLSRYRPRPDRDSAEDFLTESYAAVLMSDQEAASKVLTELFEIAISKNFSVITQSIYDACRPDMEFIDINNKRTVFQENKIDAPFGDTQLKNYQEVLRRKAQSGISCLLVTCTPVRSMPVPPSSFDIKSITWSDVYKACKQYASELPDARRLWQDFLGFLEVKGMQPFSGISKQHEDLLASMAALRKQINQLMDVICQRLSSKYVLSKEKSPESVDLIYRSLGTTSKVSIKPLVGLGEHFLFGLAVRPNNLANLVLDEWRDKACKSGLGFVSDDDWLCRAEMPLVDSFWTREEDQENEFYSWIDSKLTGLRALSLIDLDERQR